MAARVVLLSIPHLRRRDVTPGALASLEAVAARGAMAELIPAFPGLAASSFATLMSGTGPYEHGMVGNAYYNREARRVEASPLPDSAMLAPRLWERARGTRSMVWFAPNSHGMSVDLAAWSEGGPEPKTRPADLAADLIGRFGPLPCPSSDPGCEPPRLENTTWILRSAAEVIAAESPGLAVVRVPYLGQISRRYGPDGREACRAVVELEGALRPFLASLPADTRVVAVTESVTTPVSGPVFPNGVLRKLGLLAIKPAAGGGLDLDLDQCAAFALADHQICHIYLNDKGQEGAVASAFSGPYGDGIAHVAPGGQKASLGLDHPRAGDVVLVACPDRWFAPDWWKTPSEAPQRADQTCGLALATPAGLLDPGRVRGSLGAPPPNEAYHGVLVASHADLLGDATRLTARDVAPLILRSLAGG